jgi:ABC-2 type transport system permease protein
MSSTVEATAELREIRGPSAFGGGARRFFDLLWLNAIADLKLRYVRSVLGYLWTLLRPLFYFAIIYVVFTQVFRFGEQVENYAVFLIINLILFEFFADATTASVRAVVDQENVVRKMQFPRIVIPLATVLTSSFTLCLNLLATFAVILILGVGPYTTWVLLPVILIGLVAFTAGVSLILSALYVHFRDVEHIWTVAVRALLYALPVLYPIEEVPGGILRFIVVANPLAPIFEQARVWITDPAGASAVPGGASALDAAGSTLGVVLPLLFLAAVPAVGVWFFDRRAPRIAEAL